MIYDINSPEYWDEQALDREMDRVLEICNSCRLCYNLCPSFNVMFELIDEKPNEVAGLTPGDKKEIVDLCYQCKLCFPKCPYVPPHEWMVDIPRLFLRFKAVERKRDGIPFQDRMLGKTDLLGKIGSATAPIANLANKFIINRYLMEKVTGIHHKRQLPEYRFTTFEKWWKKHSSEYHVENPVAKVALFFTCTVNYNSPRLGRKAVEILHHNDVEVVCPTQMCCGMPHLDGGNIDEAKKNMQFNLTHFRTYVDEGYDVVILGPTCSYMIKQEYPEYNQSDDARKMSKQSYDISEYLMKLHKEGKLKTDFKPLEGLDKVAYHLPCHLKAQNIGFKSRDLLKLIPGAEIKLIDKCAGIDGTWGLKKEYYDMSFKVADKLFRGIDKEGPDVVSTDCPLAGLQMKEGRGINPLHPIELIHKSYGLGGKCSPGKYDE